MAAAQVATIPPLATIVRAGIARSQNACHRAPPGTPPWSNKGPAGGRTVAAGHGQPPSFLLRCAARYLKLGGQAGSLPYTSRLGDFSSANVVAAPITRFHTSAPSSSKESCHVRSRHD